MGTHGSGAESGMALTRGDLEARLGVTASDLELVQAFGRFAADHVGGYVETFYGWLQTQPEFVEYFADPSRLERVKRLQMGHWGELFRDPFGEKHMAGCRRVAEVHARIGLSLPAYMSAVDVSMQYYLGLRDPSVDADHMGRMQRAVVKLVHADAMMVVDHYTRLTQQTIADQTRALVEMSTPVATLWDDILMLPIVGIIDSKRAQDIMTSTLRRIAETRAKVFILDISGVAVVDTAVANHIIKVTKATRLMGCQALLSGVSPAIAQTMVSLGVDVGALQTKATLRDALEDAFKSLGLKVNRTAER